MSNENRLKQDEVRRVMDQLEELGLSSCFSRMTWPLKRKLHDMQDIDFDNLVKAEVFNPKHNPNQHVSRLEKILDGWEKGPASIAARIEEMARKIAVGKTTGKAAIKRGEEKAPQREQHRADWVSKRRQFLVKRYKLEEADEVQLETLCSIEYKLKELTSNLSQLANKSNLEKVQTLVDLQNSLMKSLGISRQERKKQKDEDNKQDQWESMLRSFDEDRSTKYDEAEDEFAKDLAKLRSIEKRSKQEIEEMGYYGE